MNNMTAMELLSDKGYWLVAGVIFFLGLTLGWFCKKGNPFWIAVSIIFFIPILDFLIKADSMFLTVPFILGVLVHTGKPLWERLSS